MGSQKARRLIGLLILLISLAVLAWGVWPFGSVVQTLPISPTQMQLPVDTQVPTPAALLAGLWLFN